MRDWREDEKMKEGVKEKGGQVEEKVKRKMKERHRWKLGGGQMGEKLEQRNKRKADTINMKLTKRT